MGVIKRGILGGFSGSVANVVGGSWKGIAYMRAKPLSVANPRTAGQVAQRTKFTAVVDVASQLLAGIVKPLWDRFAQGESGYNAFVSANIAAFSATGELTPGFLKTSEGSLTGQEVDSQNVTAGSPTAVMTWLDNSGTGSALGTDEVYAVVYNKTQDVWGFSSAVQTRSDSTVSVTLPANVAGGDECFGWLAFRKADGTQVSDSDVTGFNIP